MKLLVGYLEETWGEVHFDGQAISYSGPAEGAIRNLLTYLRMPGMTDAELFFSIPWRCRTFQWASEIRNDDGSPLPHHLDTGWLPSRFFGPQDAHDWRPREDVKTQPGDAPHSPGRTAENTN